LGVRLRVRAGLKGCAGRIRPAGRTLGTRALNSPKRLKVQKFDVFREIGRIRNTSDKEKRKIYISFPKIGRECLFQLKSIQRISKQSQMI